MAGVPRREAIMQRQAAKAGLTPCGYQWLVEALDPFHDTAYTATGYPDTNGSASVVQVVKQSYQIAAPSATVGNWDCNIVMMPWITNPQFTTTASFAPFNLLSQSNRPPIANIGGIQVLAGVSGTPLDITLGGSTTYTNTSNTIPATYTIGNSRVIGMAMEIVNTTSDLNRQGLVTTYRVPIAQNDDGTTLNIRKFTTADTNSFNGAATGTFVPSPPQTIAAAQLFAGTKAWDAAQGSYNVAAFNTPDVPAGGQQYNMPVIFNTSASDGTVMAPFFTAVNPLAGTGGVAEAPFVYWTEMDMSGSFFTGLSLTTTLTVNYVVIIERFPAQDDLDLIVVAHKSPEYDIKALEAYSEIVQSLPVAVPFAENSWGEWFETVANVAQDVLGTIGGTYGKIASLGIAGTKGAIKNVIVDRFDMPVSNTSVPNAPPIGDYGAPRRGGRGPRKGAGPKSLQAAKQRLKKVETRVRKDVRQEIRAARGVPKRRRRQFTI